MKHMMIFLLFLLPSISSAYVLGPTTPGKWGNPAFGTGATITYSFMPNNTQCDGGNPCSSLSDFMPVGYAAEVERAFDTWAAVADLTFNLVADGGEPFGTPGPSDIRFGGHVFDGPLGTLAHGFFPPVNGTFAAGDIHFDFDDGWEVGMDGSGDGFFDIFTVALHEIGHALGLGHVTGLTAVMNPFYAELGALTADDIAGIQFLYGARVQPPQPPQVPAPATLLLFLAGMISFGFAKSKKA